MLFIIFRREREEGHQSDAQTRQSDWTHFYLIWLFLHFIGLTINENTLSPTEKCFLEPNNKTRVPFSWVRVCDLTSEQFPILLVLLSKKRYALKKIITAGPIAYKYEQQQKNSTQENYCWRKLEKGNRLYRARNPVFLAFISKVIILFSSSNLWRTSARFTSGHLPCLHIYFLSLFAFGRRNAGIWEALSSEVNLSNDEIMPA